MLISYNRHIRAFPRIGIVLYYTYFRRYYHHIHTILYRPSSLLLFSPLLAKPSIPPIYWMSISALLWRHPPPIHPVQPLFTNHRAETPQISQCTVHTVPRWPPILPYYYPSIQPSIHPYIHSSIHYPVCFATVLSPYRLIGLSAYRPIDKLWTNPLSPLDLHLRDVLILLLSTIY